MLDIGWSEFFLVLVLGIILMGPKDIPHVIYQAGRLVRRLQYMRFALTKQFDDFMEQADLQELRKGGNLADHFGIGDVRHAMTLPPRAPEPSAGSHSAAPPFSKAPQDMIESEEEEIFFAGEGEGALSQTDKDHDSTIIK